MVHLAVYFYFAVALIGRQSVSLEVPTVEEEEQSYDLSVLGVYVPVFLLFEFLFYMGWLNVAAHLYNPFGDDDDDFAVMGLMNRHIKVCMKIVDEDKDEIPDVGEDEFWKPPPGASNDWQPSLKQDTLPHLSLHVGADVEEEEKECRAENSCIETGRVCLVEVRDPGKAAC